MFGNEKQSPDSIMHFSFSIKVFKSMDDWKHMQLTHWLIAKEAFFSRFGWTFTQTTKSKKNQNWSGLVRCELMPWAALCFFIQNAIGKIIWFNGGQLFSNIDSSCEWVRNSNLGQRQQTEQKQYGQRQTWCEI